MAVDESIDAELRRLGLQVLPNIRVLVTQVPRGTVLFRVGDPCRHYPIVLAGDVRVCRPGRSGHEVMFYRMQHGEGCAVSAACLIEKQRYQVIARTDRDTMALLLPAALFHEQLDVNATFRRFVFRQYSMRIGALMIRVESLIGESPGLRLARLLLARMQNGAVTMTHAALATDIGTAREVVSRHLGAMARAGWVRQRRRAIDILDIEALQGIAYAEENPPALD